MAQLHKKSIIKNTAFVSIALLLSKFLGIIREFYQVKYLGIGPLSDAFNTAFTIPNLLRRIFAEGALSAAFIPTIVRVTKDDSQEQASKLMTLTGFLFGALILILCFIVSFFPEPFIYLAAPGFKEKPVELAASIDFIRILIYYVFFLFWGALLEGALQAKMHFAVPAWGPALLNVFYIGGLIICLTYSLPVAIFSGFLLLGGCAEAALYLYVYFKLNFRLLLPDKRTFTYFYEVVSKFLPFILSVSIMDINLLIDNRFASTLPAGAVSLLKVSSRFMAIALGAFAVAFSKILLSQFSRISTYAPKRFGFYLLESTKVIFWITIPVALLMAFFSYDIFYTIFYRLAKNMSLEHVQLGASLLVAFLPGLLFFSLNKMLLSIYYALNETRYTMIITCIGALVNIVLNRILMPYLGAVGIALATSTAAVVQTVLFLLILHTRFGFKLYLKKFGSFVLGYCMQLSFVGLLFYLLYHLIVAFVKLGIPQWQDTLLHTIALWFWVGPLCLVLAGLVYYLRTKHGVRLYFLD